MAKNTLYATCSWKDKGFIAGIKRSADSVDKFGEKLDEGVKKLEPFKEKLQKTASGTIAIGAAITTAAAAVGGYAVKMGTEFQQASNSIGAATGISTEQLKGMDDVMKNIYAQNYGEDFQDIADAISTVTQNSKLIDPSAIQETTTNALALRDTLGFEIPESMRAVNMLMDQFGISSTEAFNLIVQGAQNGLDKNGDLLDTINEYSVQFRQSGVSAEGMFNSLLNGTAAGTFSVDKLGDAFKEFGNKVKDGSGDKALEALGISADEVKQALVAGGEAGQQAFKKINTALFSVDDKVQQNSLGLQLFGTMWEDLGADGIKALTDIEGEFDRTYDSMSKLKDIKYDDIGSALQGLKRTLEVKLLLPFSESLTPTIGEYVNKLQALANDGTLQRWGQKIANVTTRIIGIIEKTVGFIIKHRDIIMPIFAGILAGITAIKAVKLVAGISAVVKVLGGIAPALGLLLGPIIWLPIAIGAAVAAFMILWNKCEGFRNFIIGAWGVIKNIFTTGFDALKSTVSEKLNNIKNAYESHGGGMKGIFFAAIEGVKSYYTAGFTFIDNLTGGKLTSIKDKMISTFTAAKDKASDIFTSLKNKIKDVWDGIKGLIKTPHIVQDGTISIAGISTPIPKLGIRWYANGGIMTRPTAFAYSGATAHVGGESGAEAILPLSQFWNKLRQFTLESRTAATAPATNNTVTNYINVYANGKDADTVVNEIVYKLKKVLDNL